MAIVVPALTMERFAAVLASAAAELFPLSDA
jgi:hypothetical protein